MISFIISDQILDGSGTELVGLSDIELVNVGGNWIVAVASEADSAITTFGFNNGSLTGVMDTQSYSVGSGTRTVWDLEIATVGNAKVVVPATRYETQAVVYEIGSSAVLSSGTSQGNLGGFGISTSVQVGSNVYVFAQDDTVNGISAYRFNASFALVEVGNISDTSQTFIGDVSAMDTAYIGSTNYLFVASAYDTGISSYSISTSGGLTLQDTVEPSDFSGFYKPQAVLAVQTGGTDFVVMASSGTSSLTVYEVSASGDMLETDHVIDTIDMRFQDASLLDSFVYDNRTFIIAAGSDDGITVMELKGSGQLWDRGSLADTYDSTLDNVSGISAEVIDGEVVVFVSSLTDHGFTQITLDMSQLDQEMTGSSAGETMRGTSKSDTIFALGGDDKIDGRGGSDFLSDGEGMDVMTGGGGRDTFHFTEDNTPDMVTDYNLHYDQIDLSEYSGVYGMNDIDVVGVCGSVWVFVNEDVIILQEREGYTLDADGFGVSDFIF